MDPTTKSLLTTIGGYAATAAATWALTRGFITPDQQAAVTTALTTLGGAVVMGGLAEYKRRQVTQDTMIKEVNKADNGVTVVKTEDAKAASIPPVNVPLKQ